MLLKRVWSRSARRIALLSFCVVLLARNVANSQSALWWNQAGASLLEMKSPERLDSQLHISWSECKYECCNRAFEVIEFFEDPDSNLVCFDVRSGQHGQQFVHLTTFNPVFSHYLSMAQKFLSSVIILKPLSGEIVWRIEDDATIEPVVQLNFTKAGVATVAHSVYNKRGNGATYTAIVPNFHFIEHDGFASIIQSAEAAYRPMISLQQQVFWAGSTTGQPCAHLSPCENMTCSDLQRFQLAQLSKEVQWLNCSLTNAIQWCKGSIDELRRKNMLRAHIKEHEWFNYRGIIDIDGNVDAWGSRWRFSTNSVVFKVKSPYINLYSKSLFAGVHFIEISENLDNLRSVTAIVVKNDTGTLNFLSNITQNARRTMKQFTYNSTAISTSRALVNFFTT